MLTIKNAIKQQQLMLIVTMAIMKIKEKVVIRMIGNGKSKSSVKK